MKFAKKLIAFLTIATMIIGLLPVLSFAETQNYGPYKPVAEVALGNNTVSADGGTRTLYLSATQCKPGYRTNVYYKYNLPVVGDGYYIKSATLTFDVTDANKGNCELRFYSVDGNWLDTMTWDTQPLDILSAESSGEKGNDGNYGTAGANGTYTKAGYPTVNPDVVYNMPKTGLKQVDQTVDITEMVNSYYSSKSSDPFSLAMVFFRGEGSSTNAYIPTYTSEGCPEITFEVGAVPALSLTNITPSSGSSIAPEDDVIFEFSADIDPDSVKDTSFTVTDLSGNTVSVDDGDFTVSGSQVILDKTWDAYGYYEVSLSGVKGTFGQTLSGPFSTIFEVSGATENEDVISKQIVRMVGSDGAGNSVYSYTSSSDKTVQFADEYLLFQFDLPAIDTTKTLAGVEFDYWTTSTNYAGTERIYMVDNYTWSNTTGYDEVYFKHLLSTCVEENALATSYSGETKSWKVTADLSDVIHNVENNKLTIALYCKWNTKITNANYGSGKVPTLRLLYVEPSLDAISTSPAKRGQMDGIGQKIEITLATEIDDLDNIELRKESSTGTVVDIAVNQTGTKYTITPEKDLDERTKYFVVLKAGAKDKSNTLEPLASDKVVLQFTSGTALEFKEIKFTDNKVPVSYEDAIKIESYSSSDAVTAVAEVFNGSSSNLPAVMIIALYDSDDSLIDVDAYAGDEYCVPAGETVLYTKTIEVPSNAEGTYIQAFIWSGLEDIRPICAHEEIRQQN